MMAVQSRVENFIRELAFPGTAFDDDSRIYDDQPAFPTNAIHHQRWQHDP